MKDTHILKAAFAFVPLLLSGSFAADFTAIGGDATAVASWTPSAAGFIVPGTSITPASGDRLLYSPTANDGTAALVGAGSININAGAEIITGGTVANNDNRNIPAHMNLAGTGTDGNGAFKNQGNSWVRITDVALTDNATINLASGGWRHQDGVNQFALNGNAVTFTGGNGTWFVNTTFTGGGVINGTTGTDFNFEGSAILPANVTLNLSNNTKNSSWDGAGRTMLGTVNVVDNSSGIIETRQNDAGKTYAGPINIGTTPAGTGSVLRVSVLTENGTTDNHMVVSGQISGPGKLIRSGVAGQDATFTNPNNNWSGGLSVESGRLTKGAAGAIPAGPIDVSGGELALNGFNQSMTSGVIKGGVVSGVGSTFTMDGPGTKEIQAGASITTSGVALAGGVLKPNYNGGNNILGNAITGAGTLLVSGDATLKPYQDPAIAGAPGLFKWHKNGDGGNHVGDFNAVAGDPSATAGAIFSGVDSGINSMNVFANEGSKEFGNNNRFIYTGQIVNTTNANIDVSFAENYDDEIRVKIDGNTGVLLSTDWNNATQSGIVSLTPGAHTVEFMSYDGGGGQGPHDGFEGKGIGIALGLPALAGANYNAITLATMPAGLTLNAPGLDLRADRTESKLIEIDTGKTLTVDTTDMQGKKYTLAGVIDGDGGLTKSGNGVLALSAANGFAGPTKVMQGTLRLENAAALSGTSAIDIAGGAFLDSSALPGGSLNLSGKTITGIGTHTGHLVLGSGIVSPGNSFGTLTVSGDLTASGSSSFNMEIGASGVNDLLVVTGTTGTLTEGGATVNVTSLTGTGSYTIGNSWDLFNATTMAGSFGTVNLPALSGGLTWDTSALNSTGVISIVPEATSSILIVLGSMGVFLRRRRSA